MVMCFNFTYLKIWCLICFFKPYNANVLLCKNVFNCITLFFYSHISSPGGTCGFVRPLVISAQAQNAT